MRILHIEDDDNLRRWIKTGLTQAGFAVDGTSNTKEGMHLARENIYDIILLDIGMPDMNGHWALRNLRASGQNGAIFMISGQATEEAKLMAFQAGADDYLTKPIFISELVARIHRWLQRQDQASEKHGAVTQLSAGALRLDLLKRQAALDGRAIALTPKEFMLLEYLLRHTGRIVTQTALAQAVWNLDFETGSNVVEVHVNRLRKKLDAPGKPSIIQTHRGAGYMIETEV